MFGHTKISRIAGESPIKYAMVKKGIWAMVIHPMLEILTVGTLW